MHHPALHSLWLPYRPYCLLVQAHAFILITARVVEQTFIPFLSHVILDNFLFQLMIPRLIWPTKWYGISLLAHIFNTHKKILLSTSLLLLQFAKCHCRDFLLQRLFWLFYWLSYGIFNVSHVIFNHFCIALGIISKPATVYYTTYKHWPRQWADIYLYSLLCNVKTLPWPGLFRSQWI